MEYEPGFIDWAASRSIRNLKPTERKLAEGVIDSMPKEYASIIDNGSSILFLVKVSEKLLKERKMEKRHSEKLENFVLSCNALTHVNQQKTGAPHEKPPGLGHMGKTAGALTEEMAGKTARATGRVPQWRADNRRLTLDAYADQAGNPEELERMKKAASTVDSFFEFRSPESTANFKPKDARDLYRWLFPNMDEQEPWYIAIVSRLKEMLHINTSRELRRKYGDSRFHAVVGVSKGDVVGYTQFSTMPLDSGGTVVFWQYGGVANREFMQKQYGRTEDVGREGFRQEGVASAFYAFRHGIAEEDARRMGRKGCDGTILECELLGMGVTQEEIAFTKTRLHIHRQMGAKAMMIEMEDGRLLTAHLQPRLSPTSQPILLHMLFRPKNFNPAKGKEIEIMDTGLARDVVMSFIDNFDREGFDKKDVQAAREEMQRRFAGAKRVLLMPPEKLPDIIAMAKMDPLLRSQVIRDYGSMEAHEARVHAVLGSEKTAGPTVGGM